MQEKGTIMTTTTLEPNAMRASLRLTPNHHLMLNDAAGIVGTTGSRRAADAGSVRLSGRPRAARETF